MDLGKVRVEAGVRVRSLFAKWRELGRHRRQGELPTAVSGAACKLSIPSLSPLGTGGDCTVQNAH